MTKPSSLVLVFVLKRHSGTTPRPRKTKNFWMRSPSDLEKIQRFGYKCCDFSLGLELELIGCDFSKSYDLMHGFDRLFSKKKTR